MDVNQTPISKPNRLRRRERNVTARAAIDVGNTTEETLNVNENNLVPVDKIEPAENTDRRRKKLIRSDKISITT